MRNTARKGFTLLELVVVVVVIGILAGIAIPTFLNSIEKSRLASARTTAQNVFKEAKNLAAFDYATEADFTVSDANIADAIDELDESVTAAHSTANDTFDITVGSQVVRVDYAGATSTSNLAVTAADQGITEQWDVA